jgi:hypothetical protein
MKLAPWSHIDAFRITTGKYASPPGANHGAFQVPTRHGQLLRIIATSGDPFHNANWEHVSVSLANRCPNWHEMAAVKALFWDDDETVVQYHPPRKEYVNHHPHTLHMWRPINVVLPVPPSWMVGPRDGQSADDAMRESEIAMGVSQ